MLQRIRNSYITKGLAVLMAFNLMGEIVFPTIAFGLTSGPIDINQASFEPASTSEMVNLATGDFTYNIPLMDIDGYPINIAYHGGVSMEQEASMVGLGWTLNVGAMNRMKRGLPDDFKGDKIVKEMNLRPRKSVGGGIKLGVELVGFDPSQLLSASLTSSYGVSFNNYTGYGISKGFSGGLSIGRKESLLNAGLGVGLESSSRDGMSINPSANISVNTPGPVKLKGSLGIGFPINTAQGLQNYNMSAGIGSIRGSSTTPISGVTFTPSISMEKNVTIRNFDFDLGTEIGLIYPHVGGDFYETNTCLDGYRKRANGYGYLYQEDKSLFEDYVLDFNRDGNIVPSRDIAYLPVAHQTFDVYNASAQGLGFSGRPYRSDVLIVTDALKVDWISGYGESGEFGITPVSLEIGVNLNLSGGFTRTGLWGADNEMHFKFKPKESPSSLYETHYFKKFNNRSGSNSDYYNELKGDAPLRQVIVEDGGNHKGTNVFISDFEPEIEDGELAIKTFSGESHYRTERNLRNTNIEYLTAKEATLYGFDEIHDYTLNNFTYTNGKFTSTTLPRYGVLSEEAKEHHISEMTVLKGDGSRYVYGIPVVNHFTDEILFNVSNKYPTDLNEISEYYNVSVNDIFADCETGLIEYQIAEGGNQYADNSRFNRRGDNNLYIKKRIPASANSNLLSAYLSSNYIDRTGDGPTPDDIGGYTKFNYAKADMPTKWRIPFEENKAAFNEGLKSDEYDDMGTYIYGEREQWYLHSIESKNFVAVFEYGSRHDGYGVKDENGGRAFINNSFRLISISLYTRKGLENGEAAIKTVHFEYDYLLCQEVPNNDNISIYSSEEGVAPINQGGKLTLKGIYFTYGESNRGKLHKYRFDYSDNNPSYNLGQTDRWGAYLNNAGGSCDADGALTSFEFPYATQNRVLADNNASTWMLDEINLPSGSKINIEVEADDYSYVMEKPASKMFMVKGMSKNGLIEGGNMLYDDFGDNNYLHVTLDAPIIEAEPQARNVFMRDYIGDLDKIYFKFLVSVSPFVGGEDKYEYVSGYADIDRTKIGVRNEDGDPSDLSYFDTGLIYLKSVHIKDKEKDPEGANRTSPISKATWQFMRKYLPKAINPIVGSIYTRSDAIPYGYGCREVPVPMEVDESDPSPSDATKEKGRRLRNVFNIGKSQVQNIQSLGGYNYMLYTMKFATKFKPQKSWIRLYQGATNKKMGGGHRVKSISVADNWSDVKPLENSSIYGTNYFYDKKEQQSDESLKTISSGVASYEPVNSGGDENSYREPYKYTIDVKFRVNDEEYQEKPLGESIFASPQVIYSQVEVRNREYELVDNNTTGKTVYEFYTAKDFPSIVRNTNRASNTRVETKSNPLIAIFTGSKYYLSMSQGYSIQVNDMHGKFKSKTVYGIPQDNEVGDNDNIEVIYALKHKYYQDIDNPKKIRNLLPVVDESGTVENKFIGRDIEMLLDLNESYSYHRTTALQFGVEINGPTAVPSFWFFRSKRENRYRASVTTKVIYSNGILEEIILEDKGRQKRTKNLLFDEKTGVPIVTEIIHEQGQAKTPIYQYDYPAYWMYKGMGLASENWGAKFWNLTDATYKVTIADYQNFVNPGDEIAMYDATALGDPEFIGKYWIVEDETTSGSSPDYYLIDEFGDKPTYFNSSETYWCKVIRSGKRNLLGSTAASITSLNYNSNAYTPSFAHSQILNASAVEYTERAFGYLSLKTNKNNQPVPTQYKDLCGLGIGQKANPYMQGLLANWNLLASYVFDGDRDQTLDNVRKDGTLIDYVDFWKNTAGKWGINTDPAVSAKWIKAAIATIFDREGYNLESKDALGIYSAILLGYNKTLKVAEAVNARYYEIGFDGFEDREYDVEEDCSVPHFRFTNDVDGIVNDPKLAHTGRHSLKINPGSTEIFNGAITNSINHTTTDHVVPYIIQEEELIQGHHFIVSPTKGKRYVLTAWVKETKADEQVLTFDGAIIDFVSFTPMDIVEKRSNIIDGWQRIEIEFTVPAADIVTDATARIRLRNVSEGNDVYFDDIRIQPYNSEMVSYVIDPVSMRLWATLDSRNFATFYQYDEEGSLIRIIQETERGKVTVQENRAGIIIE